VWFDCEKGHQKIRELEPVGVIENAKGLSQHGCYMASDAVSKTPPRDWSGTFRAWRWQFRTQAVPVCSGFIHAAPLSLAGFFFDWAAQPYFTLITTFVFAPYFATHVASDPASGQALWGFATAAAGLMIALMSPVLGAIADASGRRKPWIAAFGALLVIGSCLMWFGKPGDAQRDSTAAARLCDRNRRRCNSRPSFNNAMMPSLVPPDKIGPDCPAPAGPPVMSAASSVSFWCLVFSPPIRKPAARCLDSCRYRS